ncbi:MAG: hypothetical protein J1F64_02960 [Oscillospiraceae bacterium]|nr:hypothetical protein [Oscillospiraceae bacterium]
MNNYKYCRRCGKLYVDKGVNMCSECSSELDNMVSLIRDYISEHPGTGMIQIRDDLEISEKDILFLIKEERIEFAGSDVGTSDGVCAKCGKPVLMEKYCRECKEQMTQTMLDASDKIKKNIDANAKHTVGVLDALHGGRR